MRLSEAYTSFDVLVVVQFPTVAFKEADLALEENRKEL